MKPIDDPQDRRLLHIHGERIIQRDIDQLLGVCVFALQDGHIDQDEAKAILDWMNNHTTCLDTWPASVLYDRLRTMLTDDHLDSEEQAELLDLVMQISRPRTSEGVIAPSALPLNTPLPEVIIANRQFCFTGVFDYGSRNDCFEAIIQRGGIAAKGITKKLDYLIVGNVGSEAWRHTSFGNKIIKAVEYRDGGSRLAIISEDHWIKNLNDNSSA